MDILGIRIGSTNTSVAVVSTDDLTFREIWPHGRSSFPTMLVCDKGRWLVGEEARRFAGRHGDVAVGFLQNPQPIRLSGVEYARTDLTSILIREVRRQVEADLGRVVRHCAFATPAYFTEHQKGVLRDASQAAGLVTLSIYAEPFCALAATETFHSDSSRSALIVRIGGQSTDVAIATRFSPWQIVQTDGDLQLGGADLDQIVAQWYVGSRYPGELDRVPSLFRRELLGAAERAKIELSVNDSAQIGPLYYDGSREIPGRVLTRGEFEQLADQVVSRMTAVVEHAVQLSGEKRNLRWDDLDSLVLHGGTTSMPLLRRRLNALLRPSIALELPNPATAAARGAALLAALAARHGFDEGPAASTSRFSSSSISVGSMERRVLVLDRGHVLPASVSLTMQAEGTDPSNVASRPFLDWTAGVLRLPLYEADSHVGDFVARLPPAVDLKDRTIVLEFLVDSDERVACDALIPETQWKVTAELVPPKRKLEEVRFTVYRPRTARPGVWYPMLAFMHLADRRPEAPAAEPDPIEQVHAEARRVLGDQVAAFRDASADGRRGLPRDGEITLVPDVLGVEFNPPRRTFSWVEDVHREEFRLRAGPSLDGQVARGRLVAYFGVIIVAEIDLSILIDSSVRTDNPREPTALATATASLYRRIFASYSHRDAEIVRQYEMYVGTLGDSYLRDVRQLRSGEDWDEGLLRLIDQADIFQLFWSRNSMRSQHVRREWEYAVSLNRTSFVRPTYWEVPLPESREEGLPPEVLRKLHFHRIGAIPSVEHAEPPGEGGVRVASGGTTSKAIPLKQSLSELSTGLTAPAARAVPPDPGRFYSAPGPPAELKELEKLIETGQFDEARRVIQKLPDADDGVRKFKSHFLDHIGKAAKHAAFLKQIEQAIAETKNFLETGQFDEARRVIQKLPDADDAAGQFKTELLDQIDDAAQHATFLMQHEQAIAETRKLVESEQFDDARRTVRRLPESGDELVKLKERLLQQIDDAELSASQHRKIQGAIDEARALAEGGQFNEARRVIQRLLDDGNEIRELKKRFLEQIDEAERSLGLVQAENTALLEYLSSQAVDLDRIPELANTNQIDMSNPYALNALLKALKEHVSKADASSPAASLARGGTLRLLVGLVILGALLLLAYLVTASDLY